MSDTKFAVSGWVDAGMSRSGIVGSFPILVVRGNEPGPTVVLTGGVHGDEYEGPAAILDLIPTFAADTVAGCVIGVPVVNLSAWDALSRRSPIDHADLNRLFPGMRTGTASQQIAAELYDRFVEPADILVDLHSGGSALVHLPLIGWYGGASEAEHLARRFDSRLNPWRIPDVHGVLSYEAHRSGKIAVAAEWGGGAALDPVGVLALREGLRRLLSEVGVIDVADIDVADVDQRKPIEGDYQLVSVGGLFRACVSLGQTVEAGDPIGHIGGLDGDGVSIVAAERSGIVAGMAHRPWLRAGDRVAYIG